MKITKKSCQDIIDYNTVGKGKNTPSYTALVEARKWLAALNHVSNAAYESELNLPNDIGFINRIHNYNNKFVSAVLTGEVDDE